MRQYLVTAFLFAAIACAPADSGMGSPSPPAKVGDRISAVPAGSWKRCQEQVRKDLKYDPQRAEFTLTSQELRAVETGEFATEYYEPLLWRFDAELLASNAFGTLVRTNLRCYIAFDKSMPESAQRGTVLFEIIEPGEGASLWERE